MTRRRGIASYLIVLATVIGLALIATFVFGRSYSELALQKEPFDRNQYTPSFDPIEDATLGLSPNSGNVFASVPNPNIHAIAVYKTQTLMLAGGKAVRVIEQSAPRTIEALATSIHDPEWISDEGSNVRLNAPLILQGTSMSIAGPIKDLTMNVNKDGVVFLAANAGSHLTISGVYVHASDANTPRELFDPVVTAGRPFILAVASIMNVDHSKLCYLGRDWNSSYGLSWSKGSTGSLTDSQLDHNFIGVYSNGSPKLAVLRNTLSYNSLYGVDPHSGSTHMDIEHNIANHNGRHGIILSDHVTAGIVRSNMTEYNGLNGIMMDQFSSGNVIDQNVSAFNKSDGIVLASSNDNVVTRNKVKANRIGITARGSTTGTVALHNVLTRNKAAGQGLSLSHNTSIGNGGEWRPDRIARIWEVAALLFIVLVIVTAIARREPRRHHASRGVATA